MPGNNNDNGRLIVEVLEMSTYCIMCLGSGIKMLLMSDEMIRTYYELLSIEINPDLKEMYGCFECEYLLNKYQKFKTKCCKAYNILCSLNLASFEVSKENLESIDRKENKLQSTLTQCKIEFCTSDNQFDIGKDATYTVVNRSGSCSEESCTSQEVLQSPVIDPITFDNNLSCQSKLCDKESQISSITADIKDEDYSLDVSETVAFIDETSKYNNSDSTVESTKEKSKLKIPQISNDMDGPVSQIIMEMKGIDNVCDNDCIILDITPTKVDTEVSAGNISEPKQRTVKPSLKVTDNTKSGLLKEQVTVIQLTKAEARKELLLRKESLNYKMNSQKCNLCYRGFNSKTTYQTHMKKHSLEYGTLKCDVCQQNFLEDRCLRRHQETCHTWKFSCNICPYICYGASQAKSHLLAHKGKTYVCQTCGKTFRLSHSLSNHIRKSHQAKEVCDLCGDAFGSPKGLYLHKAINHRMETNERLGPQCAECDVHFASELAWKRHLVLCSRHQVQFGCRVCGEIVQNSDSLKVHMRYTHPFSAHCSYKLSDNQPKNSNSCKKPHATQFEHRDRIVNEQPTKINNCVCDVCGVACSAPSLLALHQKKHSDVTPYSCSVCGKRTKYKGALTLHQRIHTNEYMNKYQCDFCGRPFSDKGRLVRHMKGHMGIRPYKCRENACNKTFINKCDEKTHYRHVHCKQPYPKGDGSRSGSKKITRKKLQVFRI